MVRGQGLGVKVGGSGNGVRRAVEFSGRMLKIKENVPFKNA